MRAFVYDGATLLQKRSRCVTRTWYPSGVFDEPVAYEITADPRETSDPFRAFFEVDVTQLRVDHQAKRPHPTDDLWPCVVSRQSAKPR